MTDRLDGWLASLDALVPVPEAHANRVVDRPAALAMLRVPEEVLDTLVARGLPCSDDGHFDRYDLYNVALHSGSERSLPELGVAFLRRLNREGESGWTERRRWQVRIELRCPRGEACGTDPRWRFGKPRPEQVGAAITRWGLPEGATADDDAISASGAPGAFAFELSVTTSGRAEAVRDPAVGAAYDDLVDGTRFQVLPRAWKADLDAVAEAGVADCVAASGRLARACAGAGRGAEVVSGFMLGLFGFGGHRWVLVEDDDGTAKVLEPTLPLLSRAGSSAVDDFTRFCRGGTLNRVIPCTALDDGEIAEHWCDGERRVPELVMRARPDKAPAPADDAPLPPTEGIPA